MSVFNSHHGFDRLYSQPFFDFTRPDWNFSTSIIFFALLERFCKIKNYVEIDKESWDWSPNKDIYTDKFIDLNEFVEFSTHYKNDELLEKINRKT